MRKLLTAFFFLFLVLALSYWTNREYQEELDDSLKNDSILNAKVKAMIDSTLPSYIRSQWESFNITSSYINKDTVKNIKGTLQSDQYFYKSFDVIGSFKIIHNSPICIYLSVSHEKVGNILEMKEMYDSIFTFYTDSAMFLRKLNHYWEHPDKEDQILIDRFNLISRAYANETRVHFGISEYEYKTLGKEFQKNFYEGLIGEGAFELAKPIFRKEKLVGFEIMELHDKTFNSNNIRAELVKREQIGYNAHECIRYVYECELYNMVMYSRYDKFDRKMRKSLKCYWNEWLKYTDIYS